MGIFSKLFKKVENKQRFEQTVRVKPITSEISELNQSKQNGQFHSGLGAISKNEISRSQELSAQADSQNLLPIDMKHIIELSNGQVALMRISRTGRTIEYVDVSLKAIQQSKFSWCLSAEYDNQIQEIQLNENNPHRLVYGGISAENSVCRRWDFPYINLSPIIPLDWHETREVFHAYKGCAVFLEYKDLLGISSDVPNITFMHLEDSKYL